MSKRSQLEHEVSLAQKHIKEAPKIRRQTSEKFGNKSWLNLK